jgi:hypothetical protein
MADNEYTSAPDGGNPPTKEDERDELRRLLADDRDRRRRSARHLGAQVVDRVGRKVQIDDEIRDAPSTVVRLPAPPRPPRTKAWKGPNAGKKFRTPDALEKATLEECHAGFLHTWGYALTDADREFFGGAVRDWPLAFQELETEARDVYGDLRKAIAAAAAFAERTHDQTYGSATVTLGDLWGRLPILPEVCELPGYRKSVVTRRNLIDSWQAIARRGLARPLSLRELAELSVLLGIGPGSYAAFFRRGKEQTVLAVSTADVLRKEVKALEKLVGERTAPA